MAEALRVKICGITRREDALFADARGADYLGVILSSGFGRSVERASAAEIVAGTSARKVAVVVDEDASNAEACALALGAEVIQLHGDEEPAVLEELRARGPWTLWKAVRVRNTEELERGVARYREVVDGILVEGSKPGVVGGGGARLAVEPERVRRLVPREVDFILAGGLTPEVVGEAVERYRPDVVDVSSGVEHERGRKDPELVRSFIDAARAAVRSPRADAAGPSVEEAR